MKRVKVTVNDGSPGRTLLLFNDPEGAYVWSMEAYDDPSIVDSIPDVERVVLLPGEYIEAEWRGCEYVYDGPNHIRLDFVRLAKAGFPHNAAGLLISTHVGWVTDCIIPFRTYKDDDIDVKSLSAGESLIDTSTLFNDHDEHEELDDGG